tara:strand:+ start:2719 stop:3813 length:1095 start_codon:yes stop_codon:yes gene_type:complete
MTHQVILLGGQLLPVYIGFLERKPQVVHILYTKETVRLKTRLVKHFNGVKIFDYQADPYDYDSIQEIITNIICHNEGAIFELNLTSGTKLMALASQQVFQNLDSFSFYIDQKQNIIDISNGAKSKISSSISTKIFLSLSGHNSYTSNTLKSYSRAELELAKDIFELRKNKSGIGELFKLFRVLGVDSNASNFKYYDAKYKIHWQNKNLSVKAPRFNLNSHGENAFQILTTGLWWELIVSLVVKDWKSAKDVHMSLAIKSSQNDKLDKNEIDILLNTGQNILFLECKAGIVTQSDINKIRTVSKFYGGISSKSILVSFFKPKEHLIEKCQDLDIEIFYIQESSTKQNDIRTILTKLDRILTKIEI